MNHFYVFFSGLWRCIARPDKRCCSAAVSEKNGKFVVNASRHRHRPDDSLKTKAILAKACKQLSSKQQYLFKTSGEVVTDAIKNNFDPSKLQRIQKVETLKRNVRNQKAKLRPKCPASLDDTLLMQHIPTGFLVGDVRVEDQRHLIFQNTKTTRGKFILETAYSYHFIDSGFWKGCFVIMLQNWNSW